MNSVTKRVLYSARSLVYIESKFTIAAIMAMLFVLGSMTSASATVPYVCPNGMVSYWTFDDSTNPTKDDYNSYHGMNYGATWTEEGKVGGALVFDGINDYVDIGQDPDFPDWPEYSVSAWFLNDGGGASGGYGQKIIAKNTWWRDFYLSVYYYPVNDGQLIYSTSCPFITGGIIDNSKNYRDNSWHHVAAIRNGTYGELWVDGILKGTANNILSPNNPSVPLYIGYSASGDHYQRRYWSGKLDEIAIFNQTLTQQEIEKMYNGGVAGIGYCYYEVEIDIKPGSDPNTFNNNGNGVIPVAILGSIDFDVRRINPDTVILEGLKVKVVGKSNKLLSHYEDVNGDGYEDLVVQIEDSDKVFSEGCTPVKLSGNLNDGTHFEGTDEICIVP